MIQITSDSTCDLGELAPKHGIRLMPLKVILDTETFKDGVDIAPADIFAFRGEDRACFPKRAQPGIEDFGELFSLLTANGDRSHPFYHFFQSVRFLFLRACGVQRI